MHVRLLGPHVTIISKTMVLYETLPLQAPCLNIPEHTCTYLKLYTHHAQICAGVKGQHQSWSKGHLHHWTSRRGLGAVHIWPPQESCDGTEFHEIIGLFHTSQFSTIPVAIGTSPSLSTLIYSRKVKYIIYCSKGQYIVGSHYKHTLCLAKYALTQILYTRTNSLVSTRPQHKQLRSTTSPSSSQEQALSMGFLLHHSSTAIARRLPMLLFLLTLSHYIP